MIISTITEAIGSTPLYRFDNQHYSMPKGSAIYAKLEYLNPGGSIKASIGQLFDQRRTCPRKKSMKNDDHRTDCRKHRDWDCSGRTHTSVKNDFCCSREVQL